MKKEKKEQIVSQHIIERHTIDKNIILSNKCNIYKWQFSGIYFLLLEDKIVYIGQTTKGLSRIITHIKDKKFNFFTYIEFPKNELDLIEIINIIKYQPLYNKQIFSYINRPLQTVINICNNLFGFKINNKNIIENHITNMIKDKKILPYRDVFENKNTIFIKAPDIRIIFNELYSLIFDIYE
jgi:hypothetical protein